MGKLIATFTMRSLTDPPRVDAGEVAVVAVTFCGGNHVEIPAEALGALATQCVVVRADGTTVKSGVECDHGKRCLEF